MNHRLLICATCIELGETTPKGPEWAQNLADAFAQSDDPDLQNISVELFDCFSACATPNALSFGAEGKATYFFAGVMPETDKADILAFAKLYAKSPDGWIDDARDAGRLRFCLSGRVPAGNAGRIIPPSKS